MKNVKKSKYLEDRAIAFYNANLDEQSEIQEFVEMVEPENKRISDDELKRLKIGQVEYKQILDKILKGQVLDSNDMAIINQYVNYELVIKNGENGWFITLKDNTEIKLWFSSLYDWLVHVANRKVKIPKYCKASDCNNIFIPTSGG